MPAPKPDSSSRTNADQVELGTLAYVEWFNHRRLHSEIGDIAPAEMETTYYHHHPPEYPVLAPTRT